MALMGSALGSEVGLRLLLSPAASNVIVRSACTIVGVGFPIYATHQAIERKDPVEQELWLVYWAAYGCFSVTEMVTDKLLAWFPMYYHAKFLFLVWLQLPNNYGARKVYLSLLRPFLIKHHARLDRIVNGTRKDMEKLIISHKHELVTLRNMLQKVVTTAYGAVEEALRAARIEGPRPDPPPSSTDGTSPQSEDDTSTSGFESVAGHPIEDPSWIEVSRADLRDRSRRP
ncbi:unnamed protein product [Calypogeia fissa]